MLTCQNLSDAYRCQFQTLTSKQSVDKPDNFFDLLCFWWHFGLCVCEWRGGEGGGCKNTMVLVSYLSLLLHQTTPPPSRSFYTVIWAIFTWPSKIMSLYGAGLHLNNTLYNLLDFHICKWNMTKSLFTTGSLILVTFQPTVYSWLIFYIIPVQQVQVLSNLTIIFISFTK